jgi:hypothetical protein
MSRRKLLAEITAVPADKADGDMATLRAEAINPNQQFLQWICAISA